ncbi:MAG: PleD family two-component system response regulator, partial [Sandaracinaceae bacterium]
MNVLVIDDSETTRKVLRRILHDAGFDEVCQAGDGADGLVALDAMNDPELVLVNWSMPRMNGLEFIGAMRSASRYAGVRVMMVTTENEPAAIQAALVTGADEFLMKPFQTQDVLDKLTILGVMEAA